MQSEMVFSPETCVEFDGSAGFNETLNATSPVREFWEWVWSRRSFLFCWFAFWYIDDWLVAEYVAAGGEF